MTLKSKVNNVVNTWVLTCEALAGYTGSMLGHVCYSSMQLWISEKSQVKPLQLAYSRISDMTLKWYVNNVVLTCEALHAWSCLLQKYATVTIWRVTWNSPVDFHNVYKLFADLQLCVKSHLQSKYDNDFCDYWSINVDFSLRIRFSIYFNGVLANNCEYPIHGSCMLHGADSLLVKITHDVDFGTYE